MVNVGVNGLAKEIKNIFVGVENKARQIKKAFVGVNGVARQIYSAGGGTPLYPVDEDTRDLAKQCYDSYYYDSQHGYTQGISYNLFVRNYSKSWGSGIPFEHSQFVCLLDSNYSYVPFGCYNNRVIAFYNTNTKSISFYALYNNEWINNFYLFASCYNSLEIAGREGAYLYVESGNLNNLNNPASYQLQAYTGTRDRGSLTFTYSRMTSLPIINNSVQTLKKTLEYYAGKCHRLEWCAGESFESALPLLDYESI